MARPRIALHDTLDELARRDLLDQKELMAAQERSMTALRASAIPWYLQPFIFAGATLAAVLVSLAMLMIFDFSWEETALTIVGTLYLATAVLLHRRGNTYADALALALSIGGHAFLVGAVHEAGGELMETLGLAVALCVVLYALYADALHRYLSCLFVAILAKAAFPAQGLDSLLHVLVAATACTAAVLLTATSDRPKWRPLAQASCTGLIVLLAPVGERELDLRITEHALLQPWIASVTMAAALLWALRWAQQRARATVSTGAMLTTVAVTAGLATLAEPGLLAALFLAVLGHASHQRLVTGVGLLSIPVFLWKYYYTLEMDFMAKSGVLVASGLLLLLARWLLVRGPWQESLPAAGEVNG